MRKVLLTFVCLNFFVMLFSLPIDSIQDIQFEKGICYNGLYENELVSYEDKLISIGRYHIEEYNVRGNGFLELSSRYFLNDFGILINCYYPINSFVNNDKLYVSLFIINPETGYPCNKIVIFDLAQNPMLLISEEISLQGVNLANLRVIDDKYIFIENGGSNRPFRMFNKDFSQEYEILNNDVCDYFDVNDDYIYYVKKVNASGVYNLEIAKFENNSLSKCFSYLVESDRQPLFVKVEGSYAYFVFLKGFYIFSIEDEANPTLIYEIDNIDPFYVISYGIVDMEIQGDFLHILTREADKLVMDISDPEDVNFLYVEDASLYNCLYNKGIVIRGDYLYFNEGNKIALYNFGRYSYYNLLGYFGEGYSRYRYLFNYNDLYLLAKNSLLLFNDEIDKTYLNVSSLYDESITKNKYEIAFGDSYYNSLKVYNDTLLVYTDSEEMSLTIYHIEDGILTYKNTEYFDYEVGINSNCNNYFVIGCRDRESVLFKINSEYELDYVGDLVRSSYIVNSAKASEYLVLKKGNIIDFVEEDAIDRVVKRIELDPNYYYTYIKDDLFISSYNHNLKLYKVNDNGDNVLIDSHSAYNGYSVFGDIVVTEEIDDFAKIQLDFYKVTYRGFTKIYEMNTNFTSVSISWFKDDNKLVIRSEYGTYLYNVQSLGSEFVVVQDKVIPAQLESNVYPNPVKSTNVNISLTGYNDLSKNINAEISIYNIKGQLIKQDKVKDLNYIWDKRDMNQKEVTSGVYLYKFIVGEAITSGKVVIIK